MNYEELNGRTIRQRFKDFHQNNPHIFEEFEKLALKAIRKGRRTLSAWMIINAIRWNGDVVINDESFRINYFYKAYYRLFVEKYPEHRDKFNFRNLRNEQSGPYIEVDDNLKISFA
jgi:hypothetical protein